MAIGRILFVLAAAAFRRKNGPAPVVPTGPLPGVSVVVPAYNEEVNAVRTVRSLLAQEYPTLEVVFVDDGSRDNTFRVVGEAFANDPRVRVLTKPNGGKASALNHGIAQARHDLLVCIDGDTQLAPDAVGHLVVPFADPTVGAVAGKVKVGNRVNWLTRWQHIEYTTSQNLDREAFALFNAVTVVPGAIGAFRRDALAGVGGFTTDTLAEDCDLTLRLIRAGHRVETAPRAFAFTEAPETLRMFLRQRFRWSFGVMQSFYKHRRALFSRRTPGLGWLGLPNILVFQLLLPLFTPFADLMLVAALAGGDARQAGLFYGLYLLIDLVCAAVAFRWEGESLRPLWLLVPQRVVYRPLMYYVLMRAYLKAIKGELMGWGLLKRTGRVRVVAEPVTA
jgi:cellulose synthase/poly-beta-1,6-N-acetylglucosamine synthase-like glycosyltransferase